MRTENSIFDAAIPEPFIVLGLRLKPFGLGHYMLLRRHGCAFVCDELATATRDDLVFACLVCSKTFDEFNAWLWQPPLSAAEKAAEVAKFLSCQSSKIELLCALAGDRVRLDVVRWGRKIGVFDLNEKVELFKQYLQQHTTEPKYWIDRESSGERGGHWAEDVYTTLTGPLGFTREQALGIPLREALLHFFKYQESQGNVHFMTDAEIEAEEKSKEAVNG